MTRADILHNRLNVVPVPGVGPEDVVVGDDGTVYAGTEDGSIFAIQRNGDRVRRVGRTDGRPLGLEWLRDGRLLICDAHEGLLALDLQSGKVETLLSEIDGVPMVFCNNAAVDDDGTIYFSDSSTHYSIERWRTDMVEDTHTGRLFRLAPGGEPELLLDGLRFANGVALAEDRSFVCVAETTGRTVVRLWLSGPRAGQRDPVSYKKITLPTLFSV
jgi:sugar lactone lactonase YvrE